MSRRGPMPIDPGLRFWPKVEKTDGCWLWTAGVFSNGYASLLVDGKRVGAHRFAYEFLVGPIPEGLTVDHRCHTEAVLRGECAGGPTCSHRRCVNPSHLEPVTQRENTLRGKGLAASNAAKTHCPQNHPYSEQNTYRWGSEKTRRICRTCAVERTRLWRASIALSA